MSILYNSAGLYHLCMRLMYGAGFYERYEVIAREVQGGASVLDVCCGDCYLYTKYLKQKTENYLGVDQSSGFKRNAVKYGINFKELDIQSSELPRADYVIMMGSLYQFLPDCENIMKKLLGAAKKKLIICEPVRNLANSKNMILRSAAKVMTYPKTRRFDSESLGILFKKYNATKSFLVCNSREAVGIFNLEEIPSL